MSHYKCLPCDHVFEAKDGAKLRCPKCMGIHDLEPVKTEKAEKRTIPTPVIPAIFAVLLVIGVAVYFVLAKDDISEERTGGAEETSIEDLPSLLEEYGIPKSEATPPFVISPVVKDFAEGLASGKSGPNAMDTLFDGIMKMRADGKWKPFHQREPREDPPLRASELLAKFETEAGGPPFPVTSYELASLLLAAARSLGLDAHMVEILRFDGEKKPADTPGKLGRFGVTFGAGKDEQPAPVYDPYSGRSKESAKAEIQVLEDREATAPFFGMRALSLLATNNTSDALKYNDAAIKLAPENPYLRMGRGLIFAASGASNEALVEFEKALKQRDDPVTRTNLAEILLLVPTQSSGVRAESEIQQVLAEVPDFGRAHGIWAMILLMKREADQAEQELALAERLDPDSPVIALYWAQFYAAKGFGEEAIQKAKAAVRLSDESLSSLIALAGIYRGTARFDEMRETLDKVLEKTNSPTMEEEIRRVFDYKKATDGEGAGNTRSKVDGGVSDYKLKLGDEGEDLGAAGMGGPGGDRTLKLGEGLGSGLGSGKGPSLGGEGLKLDLDLNK